MVESRGGVVDLGGEKKRISKEQILRAAKVLIQLSDDEIEADGHVEKLFPRYACTEKDSREMRRYKTFRKYECAQKAFGVNDEELICGGSDPNGATELDKVATDYYSFLSLAIMPGAFRKRERKAEERVERRRRERVGRG